jgi:DNA replication protein DnaC
MSEQQHNPNGNSGSPWRRLVQPGETWRDVLSRISPQGTQTSRPKSGDESPESATSAPPPAAAECPTCYGVGWLSRVEPDGIHTSLVRCACREQQIAARQAEAKAARAAELLGALTRTLGQLRDCTFDNFDPAWPEAKAQRDAITIARDLCQDYADQESPAHWLYLWGPRGTGKSHLAAAVARACAERGVESAYATVPRLLAFLKAGFADGTSDERLEHLCQVPLLVLDDLGSEQQTGWSRAQMFLLINERYLYERPTVITSNLSLDGEGIEPRIEDRIYGMSEKLYIPGPGYRRKGGR